MYFLLPLIHIIFLSIGAIFWIICTSCSSGESITNTLIPAEIMSHAPDLKEGQSRQLFEKVAVRFLEEMIVTASLDIAAVPLVGILTKQDNTQEATLEEIYQTDLGLRVRIEVRNGINQRTRRKFATSLTQMVALPLFSSVVLEIRILSDCPHLKIFVGTQNR